MPTPHTGSEVIAFSRPTIEEDEIAEVVDCLRSGWITTGPKVRAFEQMFRDRLHAPHAFAVSSATAGLHVVLHALGIGAGHEVIVPAITWASTANVVELLGAKPVIADVDASTLQMDPAEVERLLSPRTRAIVPVHFAGAPADVDAIHEALGGREIPIIEDAAHALGTAYKGVEIGGRGSIAIFSFHPIKNITTGEGGMIVCRDEALAKRIPLIRFHGVARDAWQRYGQGGSPHYDVTEPGFKYNMLDLQAALGLRQMDKLDRFNAARRRLAERYDDALASIPGITPIGRVAYPSVHAWHLYVIRVDAGRLGLDRDGLIEMLGRERIGVGLHFPALHTLSHYRERYGYRPGDLPRAALAAEQILSLPLYPALADEQQAAVCRALERVAERCARARRAPPHDLRSHVERGGNRP